MLMRHSTLRTLRFCVVVLTLLAFHLYLNTLNAFFLPEKTPQDPQLVSTRVTHSGIVISQVAERYRVRHELSRDNFNNFNVEYWNGRFGFFELHDYTRPQAAALRQRACGTSQPCVVVKLFTAVPVATTNSQGQTKPCNQQAPNWRYHKDFGNETNFFYGIVMDVLLENGTTIQACQASSEQLGRSTRWQGVMQHWPHINRPFQRGAQIEFETTISFDRAQLFGDNVNYYGQTFRYILGEGFINTNRDPVIGSTFVNDSFAQLGGKTTVPQLSQTGGEQVRLSYMQHAYNLLPANVQRWLNGRRLFHTDFVTGAHIERLLPGPQASNGNLPFPEVAGLATHPIQNSCVDCHVHNGNGPQPSNRDVVPPKLIGLGLLEGIPNQQIEAWSRENGGIVSRVIYQGRRHIGRFGWRAETANIEHQIAQALYEDMGVGTSIAGFGPEELNNKHLGDLVAYNKLLAVPTPRRNLTQEPGHRLFQEFGCNSCHKMTVTTQANQAFPELSEQVIHPYTDLLLHDLGEGLYRTAPLWGLGLSGYVRTGNTEQLHLMHDGQSSSVDAAIQRHQGQASASFRRYQEASTREKQDLINYLMAL